MLRAGFVIGGYCPGTALVATATSDPDPGLRTLEMLAVKTLETGVKVGSSKKVVRVWGDRTIVVDGRGGLRFSDPAPFSSMPLTWKSYQA